MRRRAPAEVPEVPADLRWRPRTDAQCARWGADDELGAFWRWLEARRAWCKVRGLAYWQVFDTPAGAPSSTYVRTVGERRGQPRNFDRLREDH